MSIRIEPLTVADVPTKCRLELDAFKSHPRIPMMWPKGYTSDLYSYKESCDVDSLDDPKYRLYKATDTETGDIVGTAEWTFALDPVAESTKPATRDDAPPPKNWPEGGNWAMRRFYKINIERLLKQHLHGKPHIMLNFLTVAPDQQGRGIGAKLLAWGVSEADRLGASMVLESTPAGFSLYQKYGFKEVEVINADMKEFGWTAPYDEAAAIRIFMIRSPR